MQKHLLSLFLLILYGVTLQAQVNLNSGLVAYYPFNGNTNDASGNGNNATNFGATLTTDQFGNPNSAYYFDGISNYMKVLSNSSLQPQQITLAARVYPTGFYGGLCYNTVVLDKGDNDYLSGDYSLRAFPTTTLNCNIPDTSFSNYRINFSSGCSISTMNTTPYITTNNWYCLIGTYDGTTIKMFVNGVLRYSCNYSTPIGTNTDDLFIGRKNHAQYPYWFKGKIDEVRIYNRALNQQEVDSLCNLVLTPNPVVNKYGAVLSRGVCDNSFVVDTATGFNVGDTVLMIQMKGATLDTTNTASFGNKLAYNGAGNYEFNTIKSVSGNVIILKYKVKRNYDIPNGKVQFVRVANYLNYTASQTLTATPWDGNKGGVLMMNVAGTLTLNSNIDVTGKGFRGGQILLSSQHTCNKTDYYYPSTNNDGAQKGEGIGLVSIAKMYGRGKLANGGGGGNDHNAGGGGGGNGGTGGLGGNQFQQACAFTSVIGGIGGDSLTYSIATNKAYLGGGGGAGHGNNLGEKPGANGGGIVFLLANTIVANGFSINANGDDAIQCSSPVPGCQDDGVGGGGGGGLIISAINNYTGSINMNAKGGKGANSLIDLTMNTTPIAPGGGGGGGSIWYTQAIIPASTTNSVAGGLNGVATQFANTNFGAQPGTTGRLLTGFPLTYPVIVDTFKANQLTLNFVDSIISCSSHKFVNQTTTSATGISSWFWNFGDGFTSTQQSPTHTFTPDGTYNVKLIAVDSNGCSDSLSKPIVISCTDTVINKYAAVLYRGVCDNTFGVDTATGFNVGDTVLMVQMKGAVVDTSNTISFGDVLNYNGAGNYEYNVIKAKTGTVLTLKYKVKRQYDIPTGKVQFVRVPNYQNYTVTRPHTAMQWNGSKGGVLVMNVAGTLTQNNNIDVTGKGFKGGGLNGGSTYICDKTDYYYPLAGNNGGMKGEGIAQVSLLKMYGKGKLANGGGGGNSTNAGGGGGGNANIGGLGGHQWAGGTCDTSLASGGIGGIGLAYSAISNRIYLGGGGGTGHENDGNTDPAGNGGGLVIINAGGLAGNNKLIVANGADCIDANAIANTGDGQSGGGAGGTVLLNVGAYSSFPFVTAKGGKGGDIYALSAKFGPGGGGGGGSILFVNASLAAVYLNTLGGANGVDFTFGNSNYDARPGQSGNVTTTFPYAFPTIVDTFKPNAIAVAFTDSIVSCYTRKFLDNTTTTSFGVASYSWNAGVAGTSTTKNPTFTFPDYGSYPVKLIVIDSNGCRDSLTKNVIIPYVHFAGAGSDSTTCLGVPTSLHATGGVTYLWAPTTGLGTPNAANTSVSITTTTTYTVTVTNNIGCFDKDSATIVLIPGGQVIANPQDTNVCIGKVFMLRASGVTTYLWSPVTGLSNPAIANPLLSFDGTITRYSVVGKDAKGCISFDTINITVRPGPIVDAFADGNNVSCYSRSVQLHATGALQYMWHPGIYLNDSTIPSPTITPPRTTLVTVAGTDAAGCIGTDTITIISYANAVVYIPNAFTPNGDHINDDIRPIIFCDFILDKWEVFNRWGQSVFVGFNLNKGWDGTFSGQPAPMGVYMYYVKGRNDNGESVIYKGNITLIR